MPAAAVIPAPVAYIKVVAVKKLVVGLLMNRIGPFPIPEMSADLSLSSFQRVAPTVYSAGCQRSGSITLKKLECLKQAYAVNTLAWNNNLGLRFYFIGF